MPTTALVPAVEGQPSTSPGVAVVPSSTPGTAMRSGEAQASRTEPPASLRPSSRSTAEPSARRGGATFQESLPASERKLLSAGSRSLAGEICMPNVERDCELLGNRIVSLPALSAAIGCTLCPECESPSCLAEDASVRRRLVTCLTVKSTQCTWSRCITNPTAPSSAVLNARSVLGSRFCGRGRREIKSMCAMFDLPPPLSGHNYATQTRQLNYILTDMADVQQKEAARNLKALKGHGPYDVVDCTVTCDCTWSERGFTALYGVVVDIALSVLVGLTLTCHLKSTYSGTMGIATGVLRTLSALPQPWRLREL